jgi:hypothetical protein
MSRTILRRREPEPFEIPPLPVRLSGQDLRGGLARFCAPVTIHLGPGERIIGGRVFYSAAWLDAHDLPHPGRYEGGPVAVVGDLVHNALVAGYDIGPRGITVKASRPSVTAHLVPTEDEKV